MGLFQDIADTWEISINPGSSYQAIHAGSSLFFAPCFAGAALWFAFVDWPLWDRPHVFLALVLSVIFFAHWRYLLPTAKHIYNVRCILYGEGKPLK